MPYTNYLTLTTLLLSTFYYYYTRYQVPTVVCINKFPTDTDEEVATCIAACAELGIDAVVSDHWAHGGQGALELAEAVLAVVDGKPLPDFKLLYPDDMAIEDKIRTVAQEMYRADDISLTKEAKNKIREFERLGFGHLPVCMAKTQYSFSASGKDGPGGVSSGHTIPIREVRLSAGAEFIVCMSGDIMTMPGLPKIPAAENMGVSDGGDIHGLF